MTEYQFARGAAKRPTAPTDKLVRLQWASGLPTTDRRLYAGWLIQVGQDDTLDVLLESAEHEAVTIKHGSGNQVQHWAFDTLSLFVVCDGVQSLADIRGTSERYGIALGWGEKDGRRESRLELQAFAQELLDIGYDEPILFSCRSTMTGDVVAALGEHFRVLDRATRAVPFYAFSVPITLGAAVMRGKSGAQKEICPPVAIIPEVITREYMADHYVSRDLAPRIEKMLDSVVPWSVQRSVAFGLAEQAQDDSTAPTYQREGQRAAAPASAAPARPREASPENSFYAVWAKTLGGNTWAHVCNYLGLRTNTPQPTDRTGWTRLGEQVQAARNRKEAATRRRQSGGSMDDL